jgi:tryptophanase
MVFASPTAYLDQFQAQMKEEFKVDVSLSTISRLMDEKGIVKKVVMLCVSTVNQSWRGKQSNVARLHETTGCEN